MAFRCTTCGYESNETLGACPECGAAAEGSTESFSAVSSVPGAQGDVLAAQVAHPSLVVQNGPEVGERFVLDGERFTMGRDPGCDIFLNDVTVSRKHAVIETAGGEVTIRDQGSLNGTYVNGVRVDEAALKQGDVLQVGRFQMVFLAGSGS
ncbi:MAG: hypothetical protein Kow0056_01750 [Coriobacteriia bacterium]